MEADYHEANEAITVHFHFACAAGTKNYIYFNKTYEFK